MGSYSTQVSPLLSCLTFFLAISMAAAQPSKTLKVGFYRRTCPHAEAIVKRTVAKAVARDAGLGAGLIRMHFHDCFVKGCDGSVLLDSMPGQPSEKESIVNNGLRGFEVIDKAKARIEARCPNTVSCSDILAFAARDSAYYMGRIAYAVPSGRRDGRVSRASEPIRELPSPFFTVSQLKKSFARKGLSTDDMVTLSGAHSIGLAHCSRFANRLYSFNATHPLDPSMDKSFAAQLKAKCPQRSSEDGAVFLEDVTPTQLDNVYYKSLIGGKGLLTSDQTLLSDPSTAAMVWQNWYQPREWAAKYGRAMVRMGAIDVLTGTQGEIRKKCSVAN